MEKTWAMDHKIQRAIDVIISRELPGGGFRGSGSCPVAADATAWAVMALASSAKHSNAVRRGCLWLASMQQPDGRVTAVDDFHDAFWSTAVCVLAWKSTQGYRRTIAAGAKFLLNVKGRHQRRRLDSPVGHDTSIVGWPWIDNTHSWIEPTCLAMLALKSCGYKDHYRVRDAARMIMDRQLPSGGWNYGNTTVFGKELLPNPENTGQALCALNGMTNKDAVKVSRRYLDHCIRKVRTPFALAWIIYAMGKWSWLFGQWKRCITESLELQNRYGPYDTVLLSQLVLAYFTEGKIDVIWK
jgi:hypothetical protein